jgi:colanic acid/amylovoran biosynthesis glycosyltransferase
VRIAFILSSFPALSETFILNQITGLMDLGHEVDIYAQSHSSDDKIHLDVQRYRLLTRSHYFDEIPQSKSLRLLKAIILFIKYFHKNPIILLRALNVLQYGRMAFSLRLFYAVILFLGQSYDILQCHYGPNGSFGALLRKIGVKGKLVTMFHGWDIRCGQEKGRQVYRHLFEQGDCFLSISNYNYNNLINLSADPDKIVYHPVGIDVERFAFSDELKEKTDKKSIRLLTVARLVPEKGIPYSIKAVKSILDQNPSLEIEYHIVGDGPQRKDIILLIENLDLGKYVFLIGEMTQEEVVNEMINADLFILPSVHEALPVVLMEAQAMKLPVVAATVGSVFELVRDGISGFLVEKCNPGAIAERLGYLLENRHLWPRMGECGRRFIKEHHDISKLNKNLEKIYSGLLV